MKFTNQLVLFSESIEELGFGNKTTKEFALFESFKKNFDSKDTQRMKSLYGPTQNIKSEVNFRRLKSRVGRKVLATYIISELENLNFSSENFKKTYFIFYSIARLIWDRDIDSTISILEKLFKFALKYHFSLQCRDLSLDLCNFFSTHKSEPKKVAYYKTQAGIWKEQSDFYHEVELFRIELLKHYFGDIKELEPELLLKYKIDVNSLIAKMPNILDIEVYETAVDIICFVKGHLRDFVGILEQIEDFSKFCINYKYDNRSIQWTIYYNLLLANINLKRYEEGRNNLGNLYLFLTKGKRYWLIIKGIEFNLHIKTFKYNDAYSVASEVFEYTNKIDTIDATIWQMKLAYITLIHEVINFDISSSDFKLPDFDLKKFIKRTKPLTHDKSGYNLNIKIIKILFSLVHNEIDSAYDEIEYFNVYKNKYIKKDENPRSRYFISLLLVAAQSGFHPVRTAAHAKKTLDKLLKVDFVTSSDYVNNEIIPYEFLWEVIMMQLEKNRKL